MKKENHFPTFSLEDITKKLFLVKKYVKSLKASRKKSKRPKKKKLIPHVFKARKIILKKKAKKTISE